ncbi:hypothetical protein B0T10DRAFT_548060 [Thelonectria olida]|uniref:Cytochrome b561 domain-containing protein n=1 Tax=Thelonectria olida TaxID=1576542 RepID=A0A9P8W651_9HYPO|nr:hypothetical protein B0T10DRAFT_548060 [Thelonectria olida]
MAPTPAEELSAPGAVKYDSETMTVGDGTWDFNKNTFLLPNLQGLNFDTMRYNGMGNRFSTVTQYHSLIIAHAVMAAIIFLLLIPFSVMTARFYSNRPGWAVKYHAQINIFAGLMLLAVFLLGYFAVGPERSLSNPHHGIGVAIFVMFIVQMAGGRLVRHITKARSLRIMIHQWFGRAIALLGIAQVPLGLTLYGSPKYLFILYAVWMSFLFVLYFILSYQNEGRREFYMSGARSARTETTQTRTRVTESEYFASDHKTEHDGGGKGKWLGPLAAGAGLWALTRGRGKNRDRSRSRSRSPFTDDRSRGPEVIPSRRGSSRRGSSTYLTDKYSELPPPKKSGGGGGFMKILGALGAAKLVSGLMSKKEERRHDEEYSAISTETPRHDRSYRGDRSSYRGDQTETDFVSEVTATTRRTEPPRREPERTRTSLNPPPRINPTATFTRSDLGSRMSSEPPTTPRRATQPKRFSRRSFDESDYSSYVSPSRRPIEERKTGGASGGFLGGLGLGWFAKKLADRRAAKEEQRLRDEEDMRSGTSVTQSRFTGDGYPSPARRGSPIRRGGSRRGMPPRRQTGFPSDTVLSSQAMTESELSSRPPRGNYIPATEVSTLPPSTLPLSTIPPSTMPPSTMPASTMGGSSLPTNSMPTIIPVPMRSSHDSRSRHDMDPVSMPAMPPDPQGILAGRVGESEASEISPGARPQRTRQGRVPLTTAGLATESDLPLPEDRVRYSSPASLSVKLKMHDDRERNVTLRRLTEEEAAKARSRNDDETEVGSPTSNRRRRYRRDSSQQRRAESAAERRAEEEELLEPWSPPPPNPAFAKTRKTKDSAYYSGQPQQQQQLGGPAGSGLPPTTGLLPSATPNTPMGVQTISSIGSMGESHGTWSAASPSPPGPERPTPAGSAAADNRRRRRLERRRASESKPTGADMFD